MHRISGGGPLLESPSLASSTPSPPSPLKGEGVQSNLVRLP